MRISPRIVALTALLPTAASAVIVSATTGNTTAPAGMTSEWDHVAQVGTSSGVYLGNSWVLTASHVGVNSVILGGMTYTPSGVFVALTNPTGIGKSTNSDLIAFQLTADPGLPSLTISPAAPVMGDDMVMIGRGKDRAASLTDWDVDTVPAAWVWTDSTPVPGDSSGYKWLGTNTMRWGTNEVEAAPAWINYVVAGVSTDTIAFYSDFDLSGALPNEAQAARNDSGGAVFTTNGSGGWDLSGVMLAIAGFNNQPADTAVYGNATYVADLSAYRSQLIPLLVPEPGCSVLVVFAAGFLCRRRRSSGETK